MIKTKCKKCGKDCEMGVNATVDGCDACTGVERDNNGYYWERGATEQTYKPLDGSPVYTVKREEAFKKAKG